MREHGARLFARNLPYSAWSVTHDGADDNERQSRIEYSKRDKQVRKKMGQRWSSGWSKNANDGQPFLDSTLFKYEER